MAVVSPCSQGHQWQPLQGGPSAGPRQFYCAVCGLIETVSQQAETILPTRGEPTDGQTATPAADPSLAGDLSAQAETLAHGAPAAGGDDPTAETVPPAVPPTGQPAVDHMAETVAHSEAETGLAAASQAAVRGYEVLGVLGRGGMGVVYKARQISLKRLVALKMILAGSHAGPEELARFRIEAEAVAHLQHPNIVQIYEIGEQDGLPYFSLEFVGGGSLAQKLAGQPLPAEQAARLVETLARAMHHAHQRGVVHRDLKPANVLLQEDGTPKITDFGLAKRLEGDAGQTQSGAVMGTPSYMAPEQAEGKIKAIGPLTDVYALGALLYEMLTGRPPFRGDSVMKTLQQVLTEEVVPPSRLYPRVSRDLETICLKALARDPSWRYSSALALAQDLERYSAGEPILARRTGVASRLWRRVRRSPVATGAVLALVLAVAAAALVFRGASATQRKAELTREFEEGLAQPEWQADRADQLERLIAEWEAADPEQAAAARRRLHERFAALFHDRLRQPRLGPGDVAALESDLRWMAARGPGLAETLRQELGLRGRAWQPRFDVKAPWDEVDKVFAPALVQQAGEVLRPLQPSAGLDAPVVTQVSSHGNVQLEASFDESWQDSSRIGLFLNVSQGERRGSRGYAFLISVDDPGPLVPPGESTAAHPKSVAKPFRQAAGGAQMRILRNGVLLRRQPLALTRGPLHLSVRRERDRLQFQVNGGEALTLFDVVPVRSSPTDVFGLCWPAGVGLKHLRATAETLPATASLLERGDQLYDEGRFNEALAQYQEQALASPTPELGREARCKAALCLVELNRLDEAAALFEPLAAATEGRWPLLAACQLWLIRLQQQRLEDTGALLASIRARFRPEEVAAYVPESVKTRLLEAGGLKNTELFLPNPATLRRLEEAVQLVDLLQDQPAQCTTRYSLARAYALAGQEARALPVARDVLPLALQTLRSGPGAVEMPVWAGRWYAWLMRQQGQARKGLEDLNRYLAEFADVLRQSYAGDARMQTATAPLTLDRARLHVALNEWTQAEKEVDAFLRLTPDPIVNYNFYAAAWLMKGFFHHRRGAADEARRAWKEGLYASYLRKFPEAARPREPLPLGKDGVLLLAILASLTEELPDADAEALWDRIASEMAGEALAAQVGTLLRPSPAVLRGMWRTPNGQDCARQIAFLDLPPSDYVRLPMVVLVVEKIRQEILGGRTTPEQDEVIWGAVRTAFDHFYQGKLTQAQVLQLALTWGKGTVNSFGWAGVAPKLAPALRGPLAYVLGHRYLQLSRRDDAVMFFRTAVQDAPANSALHRLAQQEMSRLNAK